MSKNSGRCNVNVLYLKRCVLYLKKNFSKRKSQVSLYCLHIEQTKNPFTL